MAYYSHRTTSLVLMLTSKIPIVIEKNISRLDLPHVLFQTTSVPLGRTLNLYLFLNLCCSCAKSLFLTTLQLRVGQWSTFLKSDTPASQTGHWEGMVASGLLGLASPSIEVLPFKCDLGQI